MSGRSGLQVSDGDILCSGEDVFRSWCMGGVGGERQKG